MSLQPFGVYLSLRRYVQAELVHCRTAMTAIAGILFTAVSRRTRCAVV